MKPRFEHHDEQAVFLGRFVTFDGWYSNGRLYFRWANNRLDYIDTTPEKAAAGTDIWRQLYAAYKNHLDPSISPNARRVRYFA